MSPARPTSVLTGAAYRLTPFTETEVEDRYLGWLNDPQVNQFLEVRFVSQTRDSALAFVRSFAGPAEKYMWAIRPNGQDHAVGTTTLYDINRNHGSAEIGLLVGDREHWGSGCSSEVLALVMRYAFDTIGLRRLAGGSYARNWGMNFTYRRLGFTREGVMRQAYCLDGQTCVDGYRWGLLVDEWRQRRGAAGG